MIVEVSKKVFLVNCICLVLFKMDWVFCDLVVVDEVIICFVNDSVIWLLLDFLKYLFDLIDLI